MKKNAIRDRTVLLLGAAITVIVFPPFLDSVVLPKIILLMLLGVLVGWFFYRDKLKIGPSISKSTTISVYLCFLTLGTSLLIHLDDLGIHRSLAGEWKRNNGIYTQTAMLIVFLYCIQGTTRQMLRKSLGMLSVLGFAISTYGYFQLNGIDPVTWEFSTLKPISTLGNTNFSMNFLVLSILANILFITDKKVSRSARAIVFGVTLASFYLILVSETIQSLLSLCFGLLAFMMFQTYKFEGRIAVITRLLLSALSVFLVSQLIFAAFKEGFFAKFLDPYMYSLRDRFYHWQSAWNMIQQNPISGVGVDSFADNYRLYRSSSAVAFRGSGNLGTDDAHNLFLQFGATGGVILMLAYVVLFVSIFYFCLKEIRKGDFSKEFALGSAVWIAFTIQCLVSIYFSGIAVWAWIIAGSLLGQVNVNPKQLVEQQLDRKELRIPKGERHSPIPIFKYSGLIVSTFFLFGLISFSQQGIRESQLERSMKNVIFSASSNQRQINLGEVVRLTQETRNPSTRFVVCEFLVKIGAVDEALAIGKRMTIDYPNNIQGWDVVASIYEATDRKDFARPYRLMTIRLDPANQELKSLFNS